MYVSISVSWVWYTVSVFYSPLPADWAKEEFDKEIKNENIKQNQEGKDNKRKMCEKKISKKDNEGKQGTRKRTKNETKEKKNVENIIWR